MKSSSKVLILDFGSQVTQLIARRIREIGIYCEIQAYNKIIDDVDAGTITGDYKSLLDDYIIDCLLYYVLASLPAALSYQFWNKGVLRKNGESTELPSMSELIDISDKYRIRAEWYGERLNKYLKHYSTTSFLPEYLSPGDTLDTILPENNTYTMPIYLGGEYKQSLDKNNCCNE